MHAEDDALMTGRAIPALAIEGGEAIVGPSRIRNGAENDLSWLTGRVRAEQVEQESSMSQANLPVTEADHLVTEITMNPGEHSFGLRTTSGMEIEPVIGLIERGGIMTGSTDVHAEGTLGSEIPTDLRTTMPVVALDEVEESTPIRGTSMSPGMPLVIDGGMAVPTILGRAWIGCRIDPTITRAVFNR